jgi:hypothetical protein
MTYSLFLVRLFFDVARSIKGLEFVAMYLYEMHEVLPSDGSLTALLFVPFITPLPPFLQPRPGQGLQRALSHRGRAHQRTRVQLRGHRRALPQGEELPGPDHRGALHPRRHPPPQGEHIIPMSIKSPRSLIFVCCMYLCMCMYVYVCRKGKNF